MAEHNRDRMDQAQDAVRERNIVRDGGIARSDADIEDVSRDTYGSDIGSGRSDDREINILCDAMRDPLKLSIQAVHIEHEFGCFFPYMN